MSSVGDAYDNAMCESFFATLECELLARRRFATHDQARLALFTFIEGWYNPHRLHSALGYRSPHTSLSRFTAVHNPTPSPASCSPPGGVVGDTGAPPPARGQLARRHQKEPNYRHKV
jgi:putative transposase